MSTKRQKRITKQVRIDAALHRVAKGAANQKGITLSRFVDEALQATLDVSGSSKGHAHDTGV